MCISGPFERPKCKLFEGDLCLDPEDEAVVNHLRNETDLKRNVIRNRKKLWPDKTVYYFVDQNLSKLLKILQFSISIPSIISKRAFT